jgi:hypothetical protein
MEAYISILSIRIGLNSKMTEDQEVVETPVESESND